MNWNEPFISPALGAYLVIGLVAFSAVGWIVSRMLNRASISDPIEEEYRGRR
jgi:hypothetical protein